VDINLNELPQNIKSQIPISLRINNTSLVLENLPPELQFILRPYASLTYSRTLPGNILDYKSLPGIYGDWEELTDLTSTVLEYIQNWFKTPVGSYPYDITFGSSLNMVLQTKDTSLQRQLLQNELNKVESLVNSMFPSSFSIVSSDISPVELADHTEYRLNMSIKLLGQSITVGITQ